MTRSSTAPSVADRIAAGLLRSTRMWALGTVEDPSSGFRRRDIPVSTAPHLVPAATAYRGMSWLPSNLLVPEELPPEAKLPAAYVGRYYAASKAAFAMYGRRPINPALAWTPDLPWNDDYPDRTVGWEHPSRDDAFTRLRLQGPNPFLLRRVDTSAPRFEADFSRFFDGVAEPTVAAFAMSGGTLVPDHIRIGDLTHRPGSVEWDDAKRVVNGLDLRYTIFVLHLLHSHLRVGQAFALSAFSLPRWHPLRPLIAFFTYGTLQVNDYAFQSLLTPTSYFVTSNFLDLESARRLVDNSADSFDFGLWNPLDDIADRGIDAIPGHPYVEDVRAVWPVIEEMVRDYLDRIDLVTDDQVRADDDIAAWHRIIRRVLPRQAPPMEGVDDLARLCCSMVFNNVLHEICGSLAMMFDSRDPRDKMTVNLSHLLDLATPGAPDPTPLAGEVLLIDQATYASASNVGANNLMNLNVAATTDDPRLCAALERFQERLVALDAVIAERNRGRAVGFEAMRPRTWEASVSF